MAVTANAASVESVARVRIAIRSSRPRSRALEVEELEIDDVETTEIDGEA